MVFCRLRCSELPATFRNGDAMLEVRHSIDNGGFPSSTWRCHIFLDLYPVDARGIDEMKNDHAFEDC
jgi:hypothetical protein